MANIVTQGNAPSDAGIANVMLECVKCHATPTDLKGRPKPMPAHAAAAWKKTHEERNAKGIVLQTAKINGRSVTWSEPLITHRVRVDVIV